MDVYAPTKRRDREDYFISLIAWHLHNYSSILVRDFNCVQSPALDQYGQHHSTRSGSPALDALIFAMGLADARVLWDHAEEDAAADTVDHFTYWYG